MLTCTAWIGLASVARADRYVPESRIESARGMALGSGVRAASASTQAQADNPANLVYGGLYHLESFFSYDPTFRRFGLGAAVVDSMTSRLAAGVSARTLLGNDEGVGRNKGWEGRLGLAIPIIDMLSVGISGRYANFRVADRHAYPRLRLVEPANRDEDDDPMYVEDRTFRLKGFTMDAAATLRPVPGLSIAALAYNVVHRNSLLAPLTVGGSIAFGSGPLTIGGDVLVDVNKHKQFDGAKLTIGGGLEYLTGGTVPLRIGYRYDQTRIQHAITGGIGYVDPRFGAHLSLRQTLNEGSETSLFFAIQFFVK